MLNRRNWLAAFIVGLASTGVIASPTPVTKNTTATNSTDWQPPDTAKKLLGTQAPEFANDLKFINSKPLHMAELRGHPVFIRFWFRDCPMCAATAPLLNELYAQYKSKGLIVIGIHHSKTEAGDTVEQIESAATKLGFKFPVADDKNWNTLNKFRTNGQLQQFTSCSFLIDKEGKIAWLHPGGYLRPNSFEARSLKKLLTRITSEN